MIVLIKWSHMKSSGISLRSSVNTKINTRMMASYWLTYGHVTRYWPVIGQLKDDGLYLRIIKRRNLKRLIEKVKLG